MKNKKGFLLAEETLKLVVAVICIGFLVYFLTSLYLKNQQSKDLDLAKASLQNLVSDVNLGNNETLIYNPNGWVLVSWPRDTVKSREIYSTVIKDDIPKFCSNLGWKSCLCICDDAINFEGSDCDNNKGNCVESDLTTNGKIKISNPPVKLLIKNNLITNGA